MERFRLLQLESRLTPAKATFDFPTNAAISSDMAAFGAFTGGGPRVQIQLKDKVIFDEFVFEHTFRGGVDVALRYVDGSINILVSAGVGGGPRVKTYTLDGDSLALVSDTFVADPGFIGGVLVDSVGYTLGYKSQNEVFQIYFAQPHPESPGDPEPHNRYLAKLPLHIQQQLLDINYKYYAIEYSVTKLSEYEHLTGLTSIEGDGNRTYEQVQGFARLDSIVLSDASNALHEVGHAVQMHLISHYANLEWNEVYSENKGKFATPYENLNSSEAFAEGFRRYIYNISLGRNLPPVQAFMEKWLG